MAKSQDLDFKKLFKSAWKHTKKFFKNLFKNIEAVILLTLASIGITSLLSQIPFQVEMPSFINPSMIIPVIAVMIVSFIVKIMEFRIRRPKKCRT